MGTRYYYICVNNRTAGIVGLNIKKTEIIHLYIKPRYRGKGISRQAVKLLEITLRTYEKRGAGVFIRKDNVLGKKFWKSLGYTYKEPSKKGRAVLYVKSF